MAFMRNLQPVRQRAGFFVSQPLLPPKPGQHPHRYRYHYSPDHVIPELPAQLGHVLEIHPIYAHDECQGNENGRHCRQHFHYLVHAVRDAR